MKSQQCGDRTFLPRRTLLLLVSTASGFVINPNVLLFVQCFTTATATTKSTTCYINNLVGQGGRRHTLLQQRRTSCMTFAFPTNSGSGELNTINDNKKYGRRETFVGRTIQSISPKPITTRIRKQNQNRPFLLFATMDGDIDNTNKPNDIPEKAVKKQPELLQPFLPAADSMYIYTGPVGQNEFIVSRFGEPTAAELTNENILKIVLSKCTDLEVNTLVWKCLGYRFRKNENKCDITLCFPKWKEKFHPTNDDDDDNNEEHRPPDFIGMQRIYSPDIDKPSLRANQALVKSIPSDNKQSLKKHLKELGWTGYQYSELTPNKTRRAQCANWLIYYREELFGYTLDELRERRNQNKNNQQPSDPKQGTIVSDTQQQQRQQPTNSDDNNEWKPPVREVY